MRDGGSQFFFLFLGSFFLAAPSLKKSPFVLSDHYVALIRFFLVRVSRRGRPRSNHGSRKYDRLLGASSPEGKVSSGSKVVSRELRDCDVCRSAWNFWHLCVSIGLGRPCQDMVMGELEMQFSRGP